MVKIVVQGAKLELTPTGPWVWTPGGDKLTIELDEADTKISGNGLTAPLVTAALDAITTKVPGKPYHHLPSAQAGKVQSVDVTLDGGTGTAKLTAGGEPLATAGTTGCFTINAGQLSQIIGPGGPVSDSVMLHNGTWRVVDPGQTLLSEAENRGDSVDNGSPKGPEDRAAATGEAVRSGAPKAGQGTALRFALSLWASPRDGGGQDAPALWAIWAPALLREGIRLTFEIVVAQPGERGGIAGRFRRSTATSSWLERREDGKVAPAAKPLDVVLDLVALHPTKPIWVSIVARLERNGASLDAANIGLTAEFAPADQPAIVVAPPLARGAARLVLDAPNVARIENDVFGSDESGRAQRLIEELPETDGWIEYQNDPAPQAAGNRDWLRWRPALARSFSFVEGQGPRRRCEPLPLVLVPDSPGLLALRALSSPLRDSNAALEQSRSGHLAQGGLALTLSGLLRGSPQIADAVRDGLPDPFDVPDCLLGPFKNADARDLHDRSGGFVRRLNAATADPISAPDLFLLLHCADLRERGLALAAAAKPLFDLIGSPAIELEQRAAMQRAGVGALTWGDTRLAGAAEAEQIWLAEIARQLEPSCSAHASATALASSIALTLGAIDAQLARIARVLDQVETKGLLHSVLTRTGALLDESATPLLTPAMKATLNRALGPGGTFANLVHNAGFAPTAGQALSLLGQARDALKPAKDWTDSLDKLAKATPGVLRYLRQPTAWHEQEIQLIEQLVSVMSVVILYGSQETRLLVSELATSVSTLRIPRRGGATLETVKWVETRIVGYHGAKGSGGAVPDGQSSFDTRAASRRTTVETQTLHVRGGGLSEDLPLGPNSPWASRIGHLGDGFAAMFSLANLAYRFSDDDAKDWAENWIAITYDAAALANLGMKHGGRALNLARVVTIAEARVNPIVSLIDAALCTYRLAIDWGEKPWWSSAGDFVALLAAIAGGAVVVMGIVSTAPLWLIVGSALLSLAAIFFPDYVPDDIKAGLALLKGQVERSSFGRLQLPSRIGPQPRPLTTLMAGDHGGSVGVLPARTQTEEEKEWADRLRDLPDSSSLQQATALTLATAAMSAKILPAQLAIQSATTPLGVPDLWLPAGKQVRGVWIKIATPALIAASARITIFPHGSERSARVQISAQVDGATLRLRADLEGAAATGRLSMYTVVGPRETNPDENAPLGALLVIDDKDRGEISASVDVPLVGATASMVQLFAVARGIGEPPPELSLPAGETLESSLRRVEESRRAASFLVKQLSPRLVRLAQE